MRKKGWIFTAVLCMALCMAIARPAAPLTVWAKELSAGQDEKKREARELATRGNMVYWDGEEKAGIYGADFMLLHEKLAAISGEIFDPVSYAHGEEAESGESTACDSDETPAVEEYVVNGQMEIMEEEPEIPEAEETWKADAEETPGASEAEEAWKADEEETLEVSEAEETWKADEEETPEVSVSGNDCMIEEGENG